MRKKQRLSQELQPANVTRLSHDGRGIASINGKVTFIRGALAEEEVLFRYTRTKSQFDEGDVVDVVKASPNRVSPKCPHYSVCGACSWQHLDEKLQIHEKQLLVLNLLERTGHVKPESILPPLTSNNWHYRTKARLSVRYVEKKGKTLVGFRERHNPRYITEMNECPVLHEKVDARIMPLRRLMDALDAPATIAQIEVAAGDDDVALIFRNLQALSDNDAAKLRQFGEESQFILYLQPAGPDSITLFYPEEASRYLHYQLPDETIVFQFLPTDFTQINMTLNRLMVRLALDLLELNSADTLLDLFCGLGNFSLPAARYCAQVVGVEGSPDMVSRALMNAKNNQIANTTFYSADLTQADIFTRLKNHQFTKLLLDPPRTGAFEIVNEIDKLSPQRIVYVSCNPATLARDADILVNQFHYKLAKVGVMDMFPHTAHVESIALFVRD
ncbi:MAG: 23S rRNA (uracil(1939)-C(5))-methyltransferase [Legionellales bacterium RIFCSPHIGHO2_12_FULL_42_9]|nr:MAG: 23S rRNA (uracil(1939)-C(5))-methyltransferase [Legionellales bacterium RIFCSPHIGHO2_12_FULL_42_9]